ncbi:MAG: YbaK/EbsC family protein [Gemmatimonadota bacterium]|nr:YbaK/EbsC family protein [Gemmatimonadota bacterium]MDH5758861.1 YbaK/EbsC family protein [Gemmatimonadota bacterium]
MPVNRLTEYLEANDVRFVTIKHSPAFTAQEIAARAHVPGKELAKTVMVKVDGRMAMVVLPAPDHVSQRRLKEFCGAEEVELASEDEFADIFPQCEVGAMPPFGNLWDVDVFVDQRLREDEEITFNAGTHTELVRLAYADFERLVKPTVGILSTRN